MATWTIGTRSSRKVCGIQPINTDKLWKSTIWLQCNDCSWRCKADTNITFVMLCWCCWWLATQRFTTCWLRLRCRFTNSKRWSCQGPGSNRLAHLTTGDTVERALIVMQSSRLRLLSDTARVMSPVMTRRCDRQWYQGSTETDRLIGIGRDFGYPDGHRNCPIWGSFLGR